MRRNWRSYGGSVYVELGPGHLWWMIPAIVFAMLTVMGFVLGGLYLIVTALT